MAKSSRALAPRDKGGRAFVPCNPRHAELAVRFAEREVNLPRLAGGSIDEGRGGRSTEPVASHWKAWLGLHEPLEGVLHHAEQTGAAMSTVNVSRPSHRHVEQLTLTPLPAAELFGAFRDNAQDNASQALY